MDGRQTKATGLKWRKRKGGSVPYWFADAGAVAKGYPTKAVNLAHLAADPPKLAEAALRQQADMLRWLSGDRGGEVRFDGTFKSLLEIYQKDAESPFRTSIKRHTAVSYTTYLRKMIDSIGDLRINDCDGRDVRRWFAQWRMSGLGAARMSLAVLKAAVSFGVVCRTKGCSEFQAVLREMAFETLPSRTQAPTADQIVAIRKAAHAAGAPLRALAYAIQFETTLRQWDVIGQWVDLSDPKPSAIIDRGKKWIGLTWAAIDNNLILAKVKPTKTETTTEVEVSFDLAVCPMVAEELALISVDDRSGPLIVNPDTGLPYIRQTWRNHWRADFNAAGLPLAMWNRDLRAGGVTEGGMAGANKDDRRKLAGHSREETTEIYDRDTVEAHRRVMQARKAFREKKD